MDTGSFLGVNRPGCVVDRQPHVAPKVKKEYSYASTYPSVLSWPVKESALPLHLALPLPYFLDSKKQLRHVLKSLE